jgi:hypothetical protein
MAFRSERESAAGLGSSSPIGSCPASATADSSGCSTSSPFDEEDESPFVGMLRVDAA